MSALCVAGLADLTSERTGKGLPLPKVRIHADQQHGCRVCALQDANQCACPVRVGNEKGKALLGATKWDNMYPLPRKVRQVR